MKKFFSTITLLMAFAFCAFAGEDCLYGGFDD